MRFNLVIFKCYGLHRETLLLLQSTFSFAYTNHSSSSSSSFHQTSIVNTFSVNSCFTHTHLKVQKKKKKTSGLVPIRHFRINTQFRSGDVPWEHLFVSFPKSQKSYLTASPISQHELLSGNGYKDTCRQREIKRGTSSFLAPLNIMNCTHTAFVFLSSC